MNDEQEVIINNLIEAICDKARSCTATDESAITIVKQTAIALLNGIIITKVKSNQDKIENAINEVCKEIVGHPEISRMVNDRQLELIMQHSGEQPQHGQRLH